ncbi:hypothetical protein [Taibaiella koreensis]|uniref:hypothetical protein n=1 Tax=Taibaiella koreensis TaxID=1268548 RepID=UPI000E59E74D|nr:hypothetical protein [Taibaiella koreensis]
MDTAALQREICKVITGIGGYIKWKKEFGLPARVLYFFSGKQPVINIEALFLGERFAVVIGQNKGRRNTNMFNASGYRIIVCDTIADFKRQFDAFKAQKLQDR